MTKDQLILDRLDGLEHRLFGNGQPGELGSIKKRIHELEIWRWKLWLLIFALMSVTGDGVVSLRHLLDLLK